MTDRFIAPLDDPNGTFDQIARALDTAAPLSDYAPRTAATVNVAPGAFKRLSPRSTGQTVLLPRADGSNTAREVTLFVEGALGTLTLRPVSGTINGSSALVFSGPTYYVSVVSNGCGGWAIRSMADGSVVTNMLAPSSVTTAKIADSNVTTAKIAANAVTNAKLAQMAARTVKLRADSAGTGDPTDGTGKQVGEIVRFATAVSDTTSTGTIVTYTLAEATNVVRFGAGIAATTIRGATIPAEDGKPVVWNNPDSTGVSVTFNDEDASAAAAGNRFRTPGAVAYVLASGHSMITCYIGNRHRIVATA